MATGMAPLAEPAAAGGLPVAAAMPSNAPASGRQIRCRARTFNLEVDVDRVLSIGEGRRGVVASGRSAVADLTGDHAASDRLRLHGAGAGTAGRRRQRVVKLGGGVQDWEG